MASVFRARGDDEGRGSGGKVVRGRRWARAPEASPYARERSAPEAAEPPSLPDPASAHITSPRWFNGLISGAGKLISSVFGSQDSSDSESGSFDGSYSDDEGLAVTAGENDNAVDSLVQGNMPDLITDGIEGSKEIVAVSETKQLIVDLLRQETFSREECEKLVQILQSRVSEPPMVDIAGLQSPKDMPDLRNAAVEEAKKYLEDKKMLSRSKSENFGPCTLNTDMIRFGLGKDDGSPVDMAKSYMESRPPWQSPLYDNSGFRTPQTSRAHPFRDETPRGISHFSLPSSKRHYHSSELSDGVDNSRSIRPKFSGSFLGTARYGRSSTGLSEKDISKILSAAQEKRQEILRDYESSRLTTDPTVDFKGSDTAKEGSAAKSGTSVPENAQQNETAGGDCVRTTSHEMFPANLDQAENSLPKAAEPASETDLIKTNKSGNHQNSGDVIIIATEEVRTDSSQPTDLPSEAQSQKAGPEVARTNGPRVRISVNGASARCKGKASAPSESTDLASSDSSTVAPTTSEDPDSKTEKAAVQPQVMAYRRGRKAVAKRTRGRGK